MMNFTGPNIYLNDYEEYNGQVILNEIHLLIPVPIYIFLMISNILFIVVDN